MPVLAPNAELLCAENLNYVTQDLATTPQHRAVAAEVARVADMARQTGERAETAKAFLLKLKHDILVLGDQITVKSTHTFLPVAYFEAISPRYMDLPNHPRALVLGWKLGNTKRLLSAVWNWLMQTKSAFPGLLCTLVMKVTKLVQKVLKIIRRS